MSMMRQMPTRSPYSRSVTAAMFCLNTALAGGIVCVPWRCKDSRVAKFAGQTSHGTIKVTQILSLIRPLDDFGLGIAYPPLVYFILRESYGREGFQMIVKYQKIVPDTSPFLEANARAPQSEPNRLCQCAAAI
jgi:hypothetical protein